MAGEAQDTNWPLPKFYFMVDWGSTTNIPFQEVSGLDIESEPMYALLDQKKGADFAYDLFQNIVKNTGMKVAAKPGFAILGKLGDYRLVIPLQNIAIHD